MEDIIIVVALVLILGGAIVYIIKQKKNGVKCIGCASSKTCSGNCKSSDEMPEYISTNKHSCSGNCDSCTKCKK